MIFMGLDLSTTNTGLVRIRSTGTGDELGKGWQVEEALLIAPKSPVVDERIDKIMEAILAHFGTHLVVLEAVAGSGIQRSNSLIPIAKLHGVVEYNLRRLHMPYITVAPASWRKALLGVGNIKKTSIALEVYKRYGYEHPSLDVVEAWALAVYACRQRQGDFAPEPKRRKRATHESSDPPSLFASS